VVIVFANQWMAESFDADDLNLPNKQDALIDAVAKANPKTVVVLQTGGPVVMPWLNNVGAVLEAWYPAPAAARRLRAC
jgi:beta-glucosidase